MIRKFAKGVYISVNSGQVVGLLLGAGGGAAAAWGAGTSAWWVWLVAAVLCGVFGLWFGGELAKGARRRNARRKADER